MMRGDEHRHRARDPKARDASPARDVGCRSVGAPRGVGGDDALYNQAELETPWEITNVNGGAVPLGQPYGMSGIRYLGSTLLELARRRRHRAIVGVCTAGGMSTAAYLERP